MPIRAEIHAPCTKALLCCLAYFAGPWAKCRRRGESWSRLATRISRPRIIPHEAFTLNTASAQCGCGIHFSDYFLWRDKVIAEGEDSAGGCRHVGVLLIRIICLCPGVCTHMYGCSWGHRDIFLRSQDAGCKVFRPVWWEGRRKT